MTRPRHEMRRPIRPIRATFTFTASLCLTYVAGVYTIWGFQ